MRELLVVGGPPSTGSGRTVSGSAATTGSGGTETPRAAPLWIPACAEMTRAGEGDAGVVDGGGPPSSALRTGFDRLRANGFGRRAFGGEWGMRWGGRRPARRPSGFLPSQECRVRGRVMRGLLVVVGPFDRLRANGFGKRSFGGEWGMRWRMEMPRASPLWIPAFAGMTRAGEGDAGVAGGGGPLRQAQGERIWEARLRWGVGDAMADGGAPRFAPLDSCLRRNDARGGVRAGEGWWCRRALRQAQGERTREARVRWGVGVRWGTETSCAASLWFPAFTGMTRAGEGDAGVAGGGGPPSTGSGRTDFGGAPSVGSGGGMGDGDAPRGAPLDCCLRRNDACGGG